MSFRSIVAPAVNCRRYRYHPRTMKKLRPSGRRSSQHASPRTRLAADIGGTFTDVVSYDEKTGRLLLGKALSTPARLVDGISHGMGRAGARFAGAAAFLHGSTIAINTMLERTREIVRERLPRAFVTASHELSREYREFERCSTVVANAYIGPVVSEYVRGIDERLKQSGFDGSFLLVQSTGGLYESHQARTQCVRMLESGPAAGAVGAQALCSALDLADAVAFDMGGTTAKAGVIYRGEALTTGAALIGGYAQALPVQIPMMDIFEVGTGGGSIAAVDSSGALKVGPKSASANPGPACYALGGREATVTAANLVLGRLSSDRFLSGEMKLDLRAADRAIREHIAGPLGLDVVRAADGILRIAATAMSYAVKAVSTERGLDAAAFALIAYGGAGPLHASA